MTLLACALVVLAASPASPECTTTIAVVNAAGIAYGSPSTGTGTIPQALLHVGFNLIDPPQAADVLLEADALIPAVSFERGRECTARVRVLRGTELPTRLSADAKRCPEAAAALAKKLLEIIKPSRPCKPKPTT